MVSINIIETDSLSLHTYEVVYANGTNIRHFNNFFMQNCSIRLIGKHKYNCDTIHKKIEGYFDLLCFIPL